MKYLIFSDVHGNLPALEQVLKSEEVDAYINLGDVVNYAPWSNECVQLVDTLDNCINIRGNHEGYFLEQKLESKHWLVPLFFKKCFEDFNQMEVISKYKISHQVEDYLCTHTIDNQYIFHDSEIRINENLMVGHSHQQFLRTVNSFKLLNPGSIGQNRKFINVSNYVIWDVSQNNFELKELIFDIDIVINEMKTRQYPQECIDYYANKSRIHV